MTIITCSILTSEFLFYILISDQIADFCHFDQETLQFTVTILCIFVRKVGHLPSETLKFQNFGSIVL